MIRLEAVCGRVLETMQEGVVVVDPTGMIQWVNQAMEKITGYGRQELVGQSCAVIRSDRCFSPEGPTRHQCQLFQEGAIPSSKCVLVAKDGSLKHVLKNAVLLQDEAGQVAGGLEIILDISDLVAQERLIARYRQELRQEHGFQGLLGRSAAMLQLFSLISSAAQTEAPVIIFGESGTGKELVAQAIHRLSSRRHGPFVSVNCRALPASLLDSELFGTTRAASGKSGRPGRLLEAHRGHLFLKEVGDLPLALQARILRILEGKSLDEEGKETVSVDVRLIAATTRDLDQLMSEGRFLQELFYRLNVIPVHLPPLRARREDIPLLAEHFLERAGLKAQKDIQGFSQGALETLMTYDWPGNVRELINAVEYATLLCPGGHILPEHLPVHLFLRRGTHRRRLTRAKRASPAGDRELLLQAMKEAGGNQSEAARKLGVSRVTLWKWLKNYNINPKDLGLF
ncbi:MAG: sigma 54-interacting transcriptional regulator [Deltaproteobacteria bacterium]|nr:sigma 54-interacting transcriptional regulator [Deltaproteobacteria bacterium]